MVMEGSVSSRPT